MRFDDDDPEDLSDRKDRNKDKRERSAGSPFDAPPEFGAPPGGDSGFRSPYGRPRGPRPEGGGGGGGGFGDRPPRRDFGGGGGGGGFGDRPPRRDFGGGGGGGFGDRPPRRDFGGGGGGGFGDRPPRRDFGGGGGGGGFGDRPPRRDFGGGGGGFGDRPPRRDFSDGPREPRETINGVVKFFNGERGFGFITPDGGGADVFVHVSAVQRSGLESLEPGAKVTFETLPDKFGKGPKAINIKLVEGGGEG